MRSGTLVIYMLLVCFTASAQSLQPVGHWREHLPYNGVLAVEEINGIIWAGGESGDIVRQPHIQCVRIGGRFGPGHIQILTQIQVTAICYGWRGGDL